ncbi:helix-turn-helix domain-containing protein [Empedobacter tilapiae]|uniref:helix-turn-helix domain-containing protein n=1 Tax=Empedobacter tilapiae TaxID=2491114 RepID=UPI0028D2C907|nr:helix-turn-helix domain-containing protein [Empedobacter tilapiae]
MILQAESFLYQNLNDYSKVLQVNKQALSIVETLKRDYPNDNFQSSSITAYINTATSYYHLKNYSKSKKYYALALNEINTSKEYDRNFYAQTCIKIAMAELKAKKPDLDVVLTYINKAKEESKNINNKEIELEINTTEADYFRLKNKYKIVDSLNTKINNGYKDIANSKIKSVQNIFNESQKKYENEKIKSFHLIVSFVTSLIIITTIVFLYYFNLKKKSQQFNLILEKIKKDKNDGIQTDILINKNKIRIMSEEKESELLEKINEFENGDLFTQKTFSMAQMSTLLESNPKYINYVLSHHKNMNFSDYINQLRINYIVKKLIDNPQYLNYKISYLADSIGFSSNSRFAYIFKKQLNITPSEFISLLKNKNKL